MKPEIAPDQCPRGHDAFCAPATQNMWADCGNVQCNQSHESLKAVMDCLGIQCDASVFVVGKAIRISEAINAIKHDIEAYRGALGYSVPGDHNGNLTDGTMPRCGLCNSEYTKQAKEFYDRWLNDSSLETWFPLTAEELAKFKALNADKFKTIEAYCRAASLDKWRVNSLVDAIDQYLSLDGYREASKLLTEARADAVNSKLTA